MPDISSIGHGSVGSVGRTGTAGTQREPDATRDLEKPPQRLGDSADRVELSDHARFLDRMRQLPAARTDRVEEIRAAIAAGTYETEEKLAAAIDRLLDELGLA